MDSLTEQQVVEILKYVQDRDFPFAMRYASHQALLRLGYLARTGRKPRRGWERAIQWVYVLASREAENGNIPLLQNKRPMEPSSDNRPSKIWRALRRLVIDGDVRALDALCAEAKTWPIDPDDSGDG